jgi:hypothetical protein
VKSRFGALVVRDRSYLEQRFGRVPGKYRLLTWRDAKELAGYCIIKQKEFRDDPRMGNMRVITIVDCLFDPSNLAVMHSLIEEVIRIGRKEGFDAIFCSATHAAVQNALNRHGFLKMPGTLQFAYYDKAKVFDSDLPITSWHLMRGDSDADSNF